MPSIGLLHYLRRFSLSFLQGTSEEVCSSLHKLLFLRLTLVKFSFSGRLESERDTSMGNARLSNARSAIFEAYSWLPPGSFPMSADRIFTFAAKQIQVSSYTQL
jgi:hypothetical protein